VDEGGLFRFGDLSVAGLDDPKAQQLQRAWEQMKGQTYSQEAERRFFNELVQSVPPGVDPAEYTTKRLNEKARTVDISISFLPQPSSAETAH